jgi:hypothetical protein
VPRISPRPEVGAGGRGSLQQKWKSAGG